MRNLQSDWMPCFETARQALGGLPARGPAIARVVPRRGIEPQPGNDRKSVALPGIDGYPFAAAALTVDAEFGGAYRRTDQTRCTEHIGNSARTIVTAVVKRFVTTAVAIGL